MRACEGFRTGCEPLHGEFQLRLFLACGAPPECQCFPKPYPPGVCQRKSPVFASREQPSCLAPSLQQECLCQETAPVYFIAVTADAAVSLGCRTGPGGGG